MDFNNKVVWITGASSGIGEALAKLFSKKGATLILSARRETELERVKKECGLAEKNVLLLPFDLSKSNNYQELAEKIIAKFGSIDILINNGGQSQRNLSLDTQEDEERRLMEVNYFSHVALSKAVMPFMLKKGEGKLIIISSIAGKFGFYLRSTYSAAKHALHGYFESLRLEYEDKGIQVLLVCPGKIKTNVSLNASGKNGNPHNVMEALHENAMSADECANEIFKGLMKGKEEIFIGGKEIKAVLLKKYFPKLFSSIIRKQKPI
jgi:short-subunit dehydrogenase